jgi:hypothetical protein
VCWEKQSKKKPFGEPRLGKSKEDDKNNNNTTTTKAVWSVHYFLSPRLHFVHGGGTWRGQRSEERGGRKLEAKRRAKKKKRISEWWSSYDNKKNKLTTFHAESMRKRPRKSHRPRWNVLRYHFRVDDILDSIRISSRKLKGTEKKGHCFYFVNLLRFYLLVFDAVLNEWVPGRQRILRVASLHHLVAVFGWGSKWRNSFYCMVVLPQVPNINMAIAVGDAAGRAIINPQHHCGSSCQVQAILLIHDTLPETGVLSQRLTTTSFADVGGTH